MLNAGRIDSNVEKADELSPRLKGKLNVSSYSYLRNEE